MDWPYIIYNYRDYGMTHLSPKQLQAMMDNKAKRESEKFRSRR